MMVAPRMPWAGVRKPPREETAGDVAHGRIRGYGDFGVGGVLPGCVDLLFGEREKLWRACSVDGDSQERRDATGRWREGSGCRAARTPALASAVECRRS